MTKYTVIHAATKVRTVQGLSLGEARQFCLRFPGRYLVPAGV